MANGICFAGRLDGRDYWVYAVMGDGEVQEGMIWEAAMSAAHYKLDHVIAFLDTTACRSTAPTTRSWASCPSTRSGAPSAGMSR